MHNNFRLFCAAVIALFLAPTGTAQNVPPWGGGGGTGGGGGGTGNAAAVHTVTFSATPTFSCASPSAGTVEDFVLSTALTANITSSTLSGCTTGETLNFKFTQDATGGRTVAMPTGFSSACQVSPIANVTTAMSFFWDGTNGNMLSCEAYSGPTVPPEQAAPASNPPSGDEFCWNDSTSFFPRCSNSAGTIFQMAKELTSGSVRVAGGANAPDTVLALTTTGSSGPATLSGGTLNIPQYSGGGGSNFITSDAFLPNGSASWSSGTANISSLGWISMGPGSFAPSGNAFGARAEMDFTAVNGQAGLGLAGNATFSSGNAPVFNISNRTFKYQFDFQADNNFTTQTIWRVGLADSSSQLPTNGVWVRYSNNNACTNTGSDTTFIGETRGGGTSSTVNTTVTVVAGNNYSVLIFATAGGTIQFQVATNGGAYSSAVTLATNLPTVNLVPVFEGFACDASGHKIWANRFVWWN